MTAPPALKGTREHPLSCNAEQRPARTDRSGSARCAHRTPHLAPLRSAPHRSSAAALLRSALPGEAKARRVGRCFIYPGRRPSRAPIGSFAARDTRWEV